VAAGYVYIIESGGGAYLDADADRAPRVSLGQGVLTVGGVPLADVAVLGFCDEHPTETTWRAWFELAEQDVYQYVRQRKAS
jgi:hypothetical protein